MFATAYVYVIIIGNYIWMTSSRPFSTTCADPNSGLVDILGMAISESNKLPNGVEIISSKDGRGYRFHPEARLLSVPTSSIFIKCKNFPTEFSFIVTIKLSSVRNDNQYLLTLLAPDRNTVLFALKIQRETVIVDVLNGEKKRSIRFKDRQLVDGDWHTVILSVAGQQYKLNVDCNREMKKTEDFTFPASLDVIESNFFIATKRKKKNRFTGVIRQIKLLVGSDASVHLCKSSISTKFPPWMTTIKSSSDLENFPPVVQFENDPSIPRTCNYYNKGMLMYKSVKEELNMCENGKWKKLAVVTSQMNYIENHSSFTTRSLTLDVEIFTIPLHGIFLAAANQGLGKDKDSTIYKWEGGSFIPYQNITTDSAQNWHYFSIGDEHFLAVANQESNDESSPARSAIYRWDIRKEKFVSQQYFQTFVAQSWESFQIKDKYFVMVANYGGKVSSADDQNYREKSWIFLWEPDHRIFVPYQAIDTIGAAEIKHFQIGAEHYIAVANSFDGSSSRIASIIYQWKLSTFIPLQYIETIGAHDFEYFTINSRHFIAVANYYDYRRKSHKLNSTVYEFDVKRNKLIKFQNIPTNGALDIEFFKVGRDYFIIVSSSSDKNENVDNIIYKWQGVEGFVLVHKISLRSCSDWEYLQLDNGEQYLISANLQGRKNKVFHIKT